MPPPLPELDRVRHRHVDANGVRLHVAELGPEDAPPVMLVHGWPQNWWLWREVGPALAGDHRVLMPDLRGFGWSEAPKGGYEKRRLADDLLALLDALGLERVLYGGHDWGGFCGFMLALEHPERLTAFLACSVPHPWPSRHDRLNPWRLAMLSYQVPLSTPFVGEAIMRAGTARQILRAGTPAGTFTEEDLDVFDRTMRTPAGARVTSAMYRTFLLRELPLAIRGKLVHGRLDLPARLLIGDGDPIARGADLEGHEDHAPRMTVERVPGVGHFLPDERPELVVDAVHELAAAADA